MSEEQVQTELGVKEEPNILKSEWQHKDDRFSVAMQALKKLQLETKAVDLEFFQRVYAMETEYQKKHKVIFQKRYNIVTGSDESLGDTKDSTLEANEAEDKAPPTPVPRFWLNILSSTVVRLEITEYDEPILEHLTDIRSRNKELPELGFFLEFHFSPNEYFANSILTKEYFYTCSYGSPLVHNCPIVNKSIGTKIEWKDGKAPETNSFFDYFNSNRSIRTDTNTFTVIEEGFVHDFELGRFLKDHIIPKAFLYLHDDLECHSVGSDYYENTDESARVNESSDKVPDLNVNKNTDKVPVENVEDNN